MGKWRKKGIRSNIKVYYQSLSSTLVLLKTYATSSASFCADRGLHQIGWWSHAGFVHTVSECTPGICQPLVAFESLFIYLCRYG